jgi:hypothetical protein
MIRLHFSGPFGWIQRDGVPSIFNATEGKGKGLYLWTVDGPGGELVYYVGETSRSFAQRHIEHLKEHLAGAYHLFEPEATLQGKKVDVWPGIYGSPSRPSVEAWLDHYPQFAATAAKLARVYRFFLADAAWDARLRHRVEAAISTALRESDHNFQDDNVRYRPRRSDELELEVEIGCSSRLLGLPRFVRA